MCIEIWALLSGPQGEISQLTVASLTVCVCAEGCGLEGSSCRPDSVYLLQEQARAVFSTNTHSCVPPVGECVLQAAEHTHSHLQVFMSALRNIHTFLNACISTHR